MFVNRLPLKIGTRGSPLALYQANAVADAMRQAEPSLRAKDAISIVVIRTTGDRVQDRRLAELGGKALFTQEIERAIAAREIDLAVHSAKDVETLLATGTTIAAIMPRGDRRDALIAPRFGSIAALPQNATVGTASLRRQAQVLRQRPDLRVVLFRGNVETRLRKLAEREVDATLLAAAGLNRLGRAEVISAILDPTEMLPAAGQGAILVQARESDAEVLAVCAEINDAPAAAKVRAERATLAALDGSCNTPVGVMAAGEPNGDLRVTAKIWRPDGTEEWHASAAGPPSAAERLGQEVGSSLSKLCDPSLLLGIPGN
jgi:hydroxymethylbilane synthase